MLVTVGILAALAGWQSFAFAAVAVIALAIDAARRRHPWRPVLSLGAGAVIGLATTLVWIRWVYGSLTPLLHQRAYRSDGSPLLETTRIQLSSLWALLPIAMIIGSVGAVIAARDPRVRALLAISTASVVGYALAFRGAAEIHDYWNYAALIPLAIGASTGFDRLVSSVAPSRQTMFRLGSLAAAAACLIITLTHTSDAEDAIETGVAAVQLAHIAENIPRRRNRTGVSDDRALALDRIRNRHPWARALEHG